MGEKPTTEQILVLHLNSVGTSEALKRRESASSEGSVILRFIVRGSGALDGKSVFDSEGRKYRFFLDFSRPSYQKEEIVFDGKDFVVDLATSSSRSIHQSIHPENPSPRPCQLPPVNPS